MIAMQTIDKSGLDMLFKAALNFGMGEYEFEKEILPHIITIKRGENFFIMENLMTGKARIKYKGLGEGENDYNYQFDSANAGLRVFQSWCQGMLSIEQSMRSKEDIIRK